MAIRPGGDGNTYSAYVPSNSAEEVLPSPPGRIAIIYLLNGDQLNQEYYT